MRSAASPQWAVAAGSGVRHMSERRRSRQAQPCSLGPFAGMVTVVQGACRERTVTKRLYNFSAGPAIMPPTVLEASARALVDYNGMGAGIVELSHRGPELDAVFDETTARVRAL